jgi:hypothetical protein
MMNPFLHRMRDYPVKLLVDIHSYCNARCTMCPYPRLSRKQSQGLMDWPLYTAIIEEMGQIGKTYNFQPVITYCYMGEPFLADNLDEYVRYALDHGVEVYLNTNAQEMTPEKIDALLAAGFAGKIHVSFHGITPDVYQRITGLDYSRSLENTLYLVDHYPHERICIRGVDDNWPEGEREKWLAFWQPYGVDYEYLPPISRCGLVGRLLPTSIKEKETVRLFGCREHHPLVEMVILFDGRAVMCCQDMARELIWGDFRKDGILGVWNGPVRKEAVERLYSGIASPKSFLCSRCEQAMGPGGLIQSVVKEGWRKVRRHRKRCVTVAS